MHTLSLIPQTNYTFAQLPILPMAIGATVNCWLSAVSSSATTTCTHRFFCALRKPYPNEYRKATNSTNNCSVKVKHYESQRKEAVEVLARGIKLSKMMILSSAHILRRYCCFTTAVASASASSSSSNTQKKRLVFMGSPQVSASVLDNLLTASSAPDSIFEIVAIVTQPPSGRDRGRKVMPSPVAQHALDNGFPHDLIFAPLKASEEMFLSSFKGLEPELCITAAYGNILPTKFLKIPSMGTVNIHPSLLPLYRGAAPVQRALQDGVKETGVSLAYTVRQLDAGPIIAQEKMDIDDEIKAPDLLSLLFARGSKLLIHHLPSILDGSAKAKALPQDESQANLAPKINPEESWISFDEKATVIHNKVRAFAGWPGTRAKVLVGDHNVLELKIITTRVHHSDEIPSGEMDDVPFSKGSLIFRCGEGTALEVLEVQLPGKRIVNAAGFWNGLRGQKLKRGKL